MAQNILNTRILLRSDIKDNREVSTLILMKGEAFVEYSTIERLVDGVLTPIEQTHIYLGNGVTMLKDLKPAHMTPLEIQELIDSASGEMGVENIESTDTEDGYANLTLTSTDGETKQVVAIKGKNIKVSADADTNEIFIDNSELNNASKVTVIRDTENTDFACQYHIYQGIKLIEKEVDDEESPIADADGHDPSDPDWTPTYNKKTVEVEEPDKLLESINVPLDMVLKNASFITVTQEMIDDGTAPEEITVPSIYMAMEIANSDDTVLYLDMKSMFNSYTVDTFNDETSDDFGGEIALEISDEYKVKAEVKELSVMKLANSKEKTDVLILYGGDSELPVMATFSLSANGNNIVITLTGGDDFSAIDWSVYSGTTPNPPALVDNGTIVDYVGENGAIVETNVPILATGVEGEQFLVVVGGLQDIYTIPIKVYTNDELDAMAITDILDIAVNRGYTLEDSMGVPYDEFSDKADVIAAFLAEQG